MYCVYLLHLVKIGGKEFYIGYTEDLKERMKQHQDGKARTTRGRNPRLIYYEAYTDKYMALRREKSLKSSGSVYMALMKRLGLKQFNICGFSSVAEHWSPKPDTGVRFPQPLPFGNLAKFWRFAPADFR